MSRPILFPDRQVLMQPALCGSIGSYVTAWACGSSRMTWEQRFDKRLKSAHRFEIADTRGRLRLTVPIAKPPTSSVSWADVRISTHDAWWDIHRVTLESAYGRTPYFEFYADRFLPMLTVGVEERFPRLEQLAEAWHGQIIDILGMVKRANPEVEETVLALPEHLPPYRQIRASSLGFIDSLSVLDLIFNLGPDAQLYLDSAARQAYAHKL